MGWEFDSDINGIDKKNKKMSGGHEDWPDIGELPQSLYEELECGHITADDVEVGDTVLFL